MPTFHVVRCGGATRKLIAARRAVDRPLHVRRSLDAQTEFAAGRVTLVGLELARLSGGGSPSNATPHGESADGLRSTNHPRAPIVVRLRSTSATKFISKSIGISATIISSAATALISMRAATADPRNLFVLLLMERSRSRPYRRCYSLFLLMDGKAVQWHRRGTGQLRG